MRREVRGNCPLMVVANAALSVLYCLWVRAVVLNCIHCLVLDAIVQYNVEHLMMRGRVVHRKTAFTMVVAHRLRVLVLRVQFALFEAVELVVLQHCRLLDHRLVWLREEVVLFDCILARRRHFSQISLQKVTFHAFLLLAV